MTVTPTIQASTRVRSIFSLPECIFCGSSDVTKEHLLADWVPRAIQRTRRPRLNFIRHFESGRTEDQYGEQQLAATVTCRECNNGWMADLDNGASQLLKPLARGTDDVHLDSDGQRIVAAWAFKTVIVNDLPITAGDSPLLPYAPELCTSRVPPSFIQVWAGPPSMILKDGFRMYGVTPNHGEVQLGTGPTAERVTAHVWRLMLGHVDLIVRPLFQWIPLPDPDGCVLLFPGSESTITLSPRDDAQGKLSWSRLPPGMTMDEQSQQ